MLLLIEYAEVSVKMYFSNSNTSYVAINQVSKEIYLGNLIYSNTSYVAINLVIAGILSPQSFKIQIHRMLLLILHCLPSTKSKHSIQIHRMLLLIKKFRNRCF